MDEYLFLVDRDSELAKLLKTSSCESGRECDRLLVTDFGVTFSRFSSIVSEANAERCFFDDPAGESSNRGLLMDFLLTEGVLFLSALDDDLRISGVLPMAF